MWNRILITIASVSFALLLTTNCFAQGKAKTVKARKTATHDRYANQEVSYRKSAGNKSANKKASQPGLTTAGKPPTQIVFEPNDEPLWARGKRKGQPKNSKRK